MSEPFRPWEPRELSIIERLLDESTLGRDEIRAQLPHSVVRQAPACVGHCFTLDIEVMGDDIPLIPSGVRSPYPVEGYAKDTDGLPIHVLIFHREGKIGLLEFVVFSDHQKRLPRADEMEVVVLS